MLIADEKDLLINQVLVAGKLRVYLSVPPVRLFQLAGDIVSKGKRLFFAVTKYYIETFQYLGCEFIKNASHNLNKAISRKVLNPQRIGVWH